MRADTDITAAPTPGRETPTAAPIRLPALSMPRSPPPHAPHTPPAPPPHPRRINLAPPRRRPNTGQVSNNRPLGLPLPRAGGPAARGPATPPRVPPLLRGLLRRRQLQLRRPALRGV